jgi:uncharacterized protein YbjT (DUF2867 family)
MEKTACIYGSTGLVGSYLLELLCLDNSYKQVIVFNRTMQAIQHPKVIEIVDDYSGLATHADQLKADEYFCCLGTTIKKAKTKPAFEYVDYHLPIEIGNLAKTNKVKYYLVVSSIGANSKSSNFYLRTKGGMEEALSKLDIENLIIFRPSMLLGKRKESRIMESVSKPIFVALGVLLIGSLKKYRAIHGKIVAKAMIKSTGKLSGLQFIESDKIKDLAIS